MLTLTSVQLDQRKALRQASIAGYLEQLCQRLELSPSQFDLAEARYKTAARWLEDSDDWRVSQSEIYPQGSMSTQTTVKPIGQDEFDVDLVCHLRTITPEMSPALVKKIIGDRLDANGHYAPLLEEKHRCWRLNYANEFHLDITPSVANPHCSKGGVLVPDKKAKTWKESNPRGYRNWFEERAALLPRLRLDEVALRSIKAAIEQLPEPTAFKGILRRCVQLCKRHRDIWKERTESDSAPISIILATLAARSYERCVRTGIYDTELDVVLATVRGMPDLIDTRSVDGRIVYEIWNDTTQGENFAEKWKHDPALPKAFYDWHAAATEELQRLDVVVGVPEVRRSLSASFGERLVNRVFDERTASVVRAREAGSLSIVSGAGAGTAGSAATRVRPNTFYGA